MKKIIIDQNFSLLEKTVCCIGYFDGVHLGHQELFKRTFKLAKKQGIKSSLICFDPDPENIINKCKCKYIYSFKERMNIYEDFGFDYIYVIKFDEALCKLKPESFIIKYLNKMNISTLVCGFDYSFGKNGSGNFDLLKKLCKFDVEVVDKVCFKKEKISSTRIKEAMHQGNYKLVNRLLNREYYLIMKCNKCVKNGTNWLIELKLKDTNKILPDDGKYVADFGEYCIIKNKLVLDSKIKINKDELVFVSFSNYE